ncbi:hypothetical protein BSL78_15363 [Apostichopus japonicus]|uniref:Uncharacterized protein n=1 Tax=Stichopus japonicus TaxID=307972 RepID=A0A2G8KIF1_STIJA|nr:hypothetical protein BSL78_15363 [Apostichopus japonicus]
MAVSSPDDSDSLRYDSDDISIGGDDSKISNLFNFVRDISKNNKLADHVEILVSEHEKRSETGSMGMKDVFTTYLIEVSFPAQFLPSDAHTAGIFPAV